MSQKKPFSELVGEALGRASMAWSETPKGIFDSDTCCVLHIDIMNAHTDELKELKQQNEIYREALKYIQTYKHPDYFSHSRGSIFDVTTKALQDAQKLAGGK